jgi:hypothetical protein
LAKPLNLGEIEINRYHFSLARNETLTFCLTRHLCQTHLIEEVTFEVEFGGYMGWLWEVVEDFS